MSINCQPSIGQYHVTLPTIGISLATTSIGKFGNSPGVCQSYTTLMVNGSVPLPTISEFLAISIGQVVDSPGVKLYYFNGE